MSELVVTLPKEFPLVCAAATILCLECFFIEKFVVNPARKSVFNSSFMEQFKDKGAPVAEMGAPDRGDGRYSQKLEYKDWLKLNNAIRVHQNFVEGLPMMLAFILLAGLTLPTIAMYVAFINVVTRLIYTFMYVKYGANSRALASIGGNLPLYALGLGAIVQLIRYLAL